MGAAPIAAARQRPAERSNELDTVICLSRFHHFGCRVADLPLAFYKRTAQCLGQFRPIRRRLFRRGVFRWGRVFGRRRVFGGRRGFGWRRRLGELVMKISKEDQDRITAAIRAAEAKTSGEIVCVLAQTSTQAAASPIFIAAVIALVLPWLLTAFTAMSVVRILSLQVITFLVLVMLLCLPSVRVALMPRKARRAAAFRLAMEQFVSRGLARTTSQWGGLLFVSPAARYAPIVVGTGISAPVHHPRW